AERQLRSARRQRRSTRPIEFWAGRAQEAPSSPTAHLSETPPGAREHELRPSTAGIVGGPAPAFPAGLRMPGIHRDAPPAAPVRPVRVRGPGSRPTDRPSDVLAPASVPFL